ncbi:hypothetical protein [Actinomadura sp. 9N215]
MGKQEPQTPPGWYWRIRIVLEAIKAAAVIVVRPLWEVIAAHFRS